MNEKVMNPIETFCEKLPSLLDAVCANMPEFLSALNTSFESASPTETARLRATFRLGQMDMQASACAMLRTMAAAAAPSLSTGLNIAADLVEELEVMNADA